MTIAFLSTPLPSCNNLLSPHYSSFLSVSTTFASRPSITSRRSLFRQPNLIRCSSANLNDAALSPQIDPSNTNSIPPSITNGAAAPNQNISSLNSDSNSLHVPIFGRHLILSGRLMLILTPVLWGGYTVCVKLLYMLPWSLPPNVFNVVRLFVAACIVLPSLLRFFRRDRTAWRSNAVRAGMEIGFWTFSVNVLQIIGLQYSSASRASFLNHINSVIVPFGAFILGMESTINPVVYIASVLSVAGVGFLSMDDLSSPFTLRGEGVLLLSAFAGAAFMLRTKTFSASPDASVIIALKICSQLFFALLYVMPSIIRFCSTSPSIRVGFITAFTGATPWLLFLNLLIVLYNGVFISWLSSIFHMKGQKSATASEGAVVFASTPIWSAIYAIPLGERFGLRGLLGATFIFIATVLASVKPGLKKEIQKEQ